MFTVLEPDEKPSVYYKSSISQHKNKLSVMQRGEWVPISFDSLDYINCETGIKSHLATVTDGDDIGYEYCVDEVKLLSEVYLMYNYSIDEHGFNLCAFTKDDCGRLGEYNKQILRIGLNYAQADETLQPDDTDAMPVLEPDEKPEVFYHSSISQYRNRLSVMQRGEWVPISFDVLDYINCETGVGSHLSTVTDGDDIGFDFPVDEETLLSDTYLTADYERTYFKDLPIWFGTGKYEKHEQGRAFVNSDCESLGRRDSQTIRIGTSYALALKTLEADD